MHTESTFKINQPSFSGPLDLLLDLIEKRKLLINDVSLSQVTDDYISHIKQFNDYPLSDSASFILTASTLLLIKSKSLLPSLELSEEEQTSIEELEVRLKLYKRFKELSLNVAERYGKNPIFARSFIEPTPIFSPGNNILLTAILDSILSAINALPRGSAIQTTIIKKVISLEEMINRLTVRIKFSIKMSFREFSGIGKEERINVIVSFLALLELVKQGIVSAVQSGNHSDIEIETGQVDVPRYTG